VKDLILNSRFNPAQPERSIEHARGRRRIRTLSADLARTVAGSDHEITIVGT
jgi:hypothetical protein